MKTSFFLQCPPMGIAIKIGHYQYNIHGRKAVLKSRVLTRKVIQNEFLKRAFQSNFSRKYFL